MTRCLDCPRRASLSGRAQRCVICRPAHDLAMARARRQRVREERRQREAARIEAQFARLTRQQPKWRAA